MPADVRQAKRPRVVDQDAEDAAPVRQRTDGPTGGVIDADGKEALELRALLVQYAQCGVARAGDLLCLFEDSVQHRLGIQFGDQRSPHVEQAADPVVD